MSDPGDPQTSEQQDPGRWFRNIMNILAKDGLLSKGEGRGVSILSMGIQERTNTYRLVHPRIPKMKTDRLNFRAICDMVRCGAVW